jgi:hypothetical protein
MGQEPNHRQCHWSGYLSEASTRLFMCQSLPARRLLPALASSPRLAAKGQRSPDPVERQREIARVQGDVAEIPERPVRVPADHQLILRPFPRRIVSDS